MTLVTLLRILSVLIACGLGVLIVSQGEPGHLRWWMGALPFALWVTGPALVPGLMVNRRSRQWFSVTMFLYLVGITIVSGFAYYDAFFRSRSSTAALVLVFIPLYQWLAIALLLLLCFGIRRGHRSVGKARERSSRGASPRAEQIDP